MTIGERIRHRREEIHMSQEELAKLVGYNSRTSVCKLESSADGRDIKMSKLPIFAKALNCSVEYLMYGEDYEGTMNEVKLTSDNNATPLTEEEKLIFDEIHKMTMAEKMLLYAELVKRNKEGEL